MIKIKAVIKLYGTSLGRKTPFLSGYRPLFNFVDGMKTSGKIQLLDRNEFYPNDEGEVEIVFLNREYLGKNFRVGAKFTFDEGAQKLGEGEVKQML